MQNQEPVQILVSRNAVMIQLAVGFAMSTINTRITDVHVMSPAMQGMTAVQMQKYFVNVGEVLQILCLRLFICTLYIYIFQHLSLDENSDFVHVGNV